MTPGVLIVALLINACFIYVYAYIFIVCDIPKNHCYLLDRYKGTFAEGKPVNVLRYEKGRKKRRLTQDEHR